MGVGNTKPARKSGKRTTWALAGLTLIVLAFSLPGSLRDMLNRGEIYLFSRAFFEDIPKRLTGPGRFRFVMQPALAIILGIPGGRADARTGRPPFLYGILLHRELRGELVKSAYATIANLLLMGILLDAIFQWVILGASHPGAALLLGPVLIVVPYSLARAVSNRLSRKGKSPDRIDRDAP